MAYADPIVRREKQRQYNQTYYKKHPQKRAQLNVEARQRNRIKAAAYLATHPCIDCGETDVLVLDFDHTRDKRMDIAVMINRPCSWATIEKEIEKCVVRCANCHRRKTAREQGWFKSLAETEKVSQLII